MKLHIQAGTNSGCCFYTDITVNEDYSMNEIITIIKNRGYDYFRICDTMKVFVDLQGKVLKC